MFEEKNLGNCRFSFTITFENCPNLNSRIILKSLYNFYFYYLKKKVFIIFIFSLLYKKNVHSNSWIFLFFLWPLKTFEL